ncbi:MAG: hypothetical protein Q8R81_01020 [Novosphingobium sp.]|uniref:hypothetical protein n=1 Tax=Novosphingobium sp. TaxID=1874826 RepID=UPI0027345E0B|nr:hypothetical protein [Novosphingobium sp.]MDP3548957.1 hypothetical protein [Novosphingobium sp.]
MAFDTLQFWGPILAGTGAGALCAGLGRVVAPRRKPKPGWGQVRPGALHWTGLTLSAGLAGLMAYVGAFIGSARADGATQMQVLWWLMVAFAIGAAFSLLQMYRIARADIVWRGGKVQFNGAGGTRTERQIADVMSLTRSASGWFVAMFDDGAVLRIDPYAKGAEALMDRLVEIAGEGGATAL